GLRRGFVIYDDDDQLDLLKEVMGNLPGVGPDANPRQLRAVIDRAKGNLWTPEDLARSGEDMMAGLPRATAVEGYRRYQARLRGTNAIDFNDLIVETVRLFREMPAVLNKIQNRARFIHVDEYQDTNRAQYELTRLLASRDRNLLVVGDPDQCLPPDTLVRTTRGCVRIEDVREGDCTFGTGGGKTLVPSVVRHVKRGHYRGSMWRINAGGKTLEGTPHHVLLSRIEPTEGKWYVYLMYREDRGYRVGITKSMRSGDDGKSEHGFRVRLNQEHGDKLWVLRVCGTAQEARFHEVLYSARYGLPTVLFHAVGRNLAFDDDHLRRLYEALDTRSAAERLMRDLHLHPDFPHYRPQNGARRHTVNVVMYQDNRHGGVGYHRVQWCSSTPDRIDRVRAAGIEIRSNGKGKDGYRFESSRKSYVDALDVARAIADAGGMEIQRRAWIDGQMYAFTPLSHLHEGMRVLVEQGGRLEETEVTSVSQFDYDGPVYDLTVDPTHTYLAGGVLVHNSIYKFRGADINNILDFKKDYPDSRTYRLEHNYRSSARVLELANKLIENNTERLEKTLRPVKNEGEPVRFHRAPDHRAEADFVAERITRLRAEGVKFADIAVLYRTNAQSRVLEESMRRLGIPARIVGGVGFYDRREIRDVLAYARLALNPGDDVALRRIVGRPR
ncbi:UvrD-helicase domain-containing protein, partial [Deinococcus pimensis]|uniref:UvrD-helicase domain-containing protein n=1 Tax=Deinococcus pimensis TaxID=309888 RepID=UPI0005EB74A8